MEGIIYAEEGGHLYPEVFKAETIQQVHLATVSGKVPKPKELAPVDTTTSAIRCNTRQAGEERMAYLCGICNPVQTPATKYYHS